MSRPPFYARKIDDNQPEIVKALRRVPGITVKVMSRQSDGVADLIVKREHGGQVTRRWLEIKDGSKPPSARALTPAEEEFRDLVGHDAYAVVLSPDDALVAMGVLPSPCGASHDPPAADARGVPPACSGAAPARRRARGPGRPV